MNKTELIAAVADKAGLTKKDVEKAITATLETIKEEVATGGKVQVVGFGTFEARSRKERIGKNQGRSYHSCCDRSRIQSW